MNMEANRMFNRNYVNLAGGIIRQATEDLALYAAIERVIAEELPEKSALAIKSYRRANNARKTKTCRWFASELFKNLSCGDEQSMKKTARLCLQQAAELSQSEAIKSTARAEVRENLRRHNIKF